MIAGAYGAALGANIGWILGLGLACAGVIAVMTLSPVIVVTPSHLRVGPATLPRSVISACVPLDRAAAALARGTQADARTYVMLRSLHAPTAVRVELNDPQDPHPSWLVTTANPEALAKALSS
jgi:hypothetical protein